MILLITIVYFLLDPPGHQTRTSVGRTAFAAWKQREQGFQLLSCLSQWLTAMGFRYVSWLPVVYLFT